MKKRGISGALPFFILFLLLGVGAIIWYAVRLNSDSLIISHNSGIYGEAFQLKMYTLRAGEIYYTLDGSEPNPENAASYRYEEPLEIDLSSESDDKGAGTQIYSLQIRAFYEDGEVSPIYSREYILESKGLSRFTTNYIISVTGTEEQLFDYDTGIFVRGRQYDEYMAANPDVDILNTVIPANYFSEEEVPVHVSIFSREGAELVSKQCGLRISGNITRAKNQKSFRLYARTEYDGVNEFSGAFLSRLTSDETNTVINEYQRLALHNSGNDNGYGFMRTVLIGELARQYGFSDVLVGESATVYVNGRYQGVYWLENTFDDKYFKEKYGDYTGEMAVAEGTLSYMYPDLAESEIELAGAREYNEFCSWIAEADLSVEENWQKVCDTIDIQNFAQYMAIEYYVGNRDWVDNNVKVYRYYSDSNQYTEGTVFDGKYRYLLFDTDYGMGLQFLGWFGYDVTTERLETLCAGYGAEIFSSMMTREEFKNLFVNAVLVLMEGSFELENVREALLGFAGMTDSEIQFMYEETDLMKNSLWESDDIDFQHVMGERHIILTYAEQRPEFVKGEMAGVLDAGEIYRLSLESLESGNWNIDGLDAGMAYDGYCYEKIPMTISCQLPTGQAVLGYYVNGNYVSGTVLELEALQWVNAGGEINIRPEIAVAEQEELRIFAYDTKGDEDYVVLINSGNVELLLSDYAVSDSEEASKGRLPGVVLQPGEIYYVYGKNNTSEVPDNGIKVSFSWNDQEEVILSNIEDGMIERKGSIR